MLGWFAAISLGLLGCSENGKNEPVRVVIVEDGALRLLDLGRILRPTPLGLGPIHTVDVNQRTSRVYYTRSSEQGPMLSTIDGTVLTENTTLNLELATFLTTERVPGSIAVDEITGRAFIGDLAPELPDDRGLVVFDESARSLSRIPIPGLVSGLAVNEEARTLYAFCGHTQNGNVVRQMVTFDLDVDPLTPSFSVPTSRAEGLPRIFNPGVVAPDSGLVFFEAGRTSRTDPFCNSQQCEIWVLDAASNTFLDSSLLVLSTTGAVTMRIAALEVAEVSGRETLIAVTKDQAFLWETALVRSGVTQPLFTWPHSLAADTSVTAVAYTSQTDRVAVGNGKGELALFASNGTPVVGGSPVQIPGATPGMQICGLTTSREGLLYVVLGGFDPAPRAGLIAVLDLSGNVALDQAVSIVGTVDAVGISNPLALDEGRGVLYTNAVVE